MRLVPRQGSVTIVGIGGAARGPSRPAEGSVVRSRTLGPYRLERRLATGGMAEVYVALRHGLHGFQRRVALKCILPQHAKDPDFVSMFIDEARIASRLDHPNIVQVFDFGEADGTLFLAMEFVDGSSVHRLLKASSERAVPVPLAAALHIGIEAARGLAHAHHARAERGRPLGLVHRDVSPANLLLGRRGTVKLSDFGIARWSRSEHRTDDGLIRGKLGYMSPEQVRSLPLDAKSDVFTLATVLGELVVGEPLFSASTDLDVLLKIRASDRSVLDRHARALPEDVTATLGRALSPLPQDRPDAGAFADALEALSRVHGHSGRGARELSRAMRHLGLVTANADEAAASEPGASSRTLERPAPPSDEATGEQTTANGRGPGLAADAWELLLQDGRTRGPLSFPELVRAIVVGEVDARTPLRFGGRPAVAAAEFPSLQRYLRSTALGWNAGEFEGAEAKGPIVAGTVLARAHRVASAAETGVLYLEEGARRKKIYFVDGRPDFVASTLEEEMLGAFLVREGICRTHEVESALAMLPRFDGRLGDALVSMGALRPVQLFRAIAGQVRARYLEAFRWTSGTWTWKAGARSGEETYPLTQPPHELLRDAAALAPAAEVEAALGALAGRTMRRASSPPSPAGAFRMTEAWTAILDVRGEATLGSIVLREAGAGHEVLEIYRAFYLALMTGLVDVC